MRACLGLLLDPTAHDPGTPPPPTAPHTMEEKMGHNLAQVRLSLSWGNPRQLPRKGANQAHLLLLAPLQEIPATSKQDHQPITGGYLDISLIGIFYTANFRSVKVSATCTSP